MRRILAAVAVLVSAVVLLTGCSSSTTAVSTVGPEEFSSVASQAGTRVIDVRTPAEFATGHLPGAVNIDVESASFAEEVAALDTSATYAVYCRSGNRSTTATQQMADAGIQRIYELDGGINAWTGAGLPVAR